MILVFEKGKKMCLSVKIFFVVMTLILLLFILLLYVLRKKVDKKKPVDMCIIAYFSVLIALILMGLRGQISDFLSIIVANMMILYTYSFFWKGMRIFFEEKEIFFIEYILPLLILPCISYFLYIDNYMGARVIVISIFVCIYDILFLCELKDKDVNGKWIAKIVYVLNILFSLYRICWIVFLSTGDDFFSLRLILELTGVFSMSVIIINGIFIQIITFTEMIKKIDGKRLKEKEEKEEVIRVCQKKELLITKISHELRTPINGIKGMAQLIEETNDVEKKGKYIREIIESSSYLEGEIKNVLNSTKRMFSKIEVEFYLEKILESIKNTFYKTLQEKKIHMFYYMEKEVPSILIGNERCLKQILLNIVGNAVKFTNEGGIYIRIRKKKQEKNKVELEFIIRDTGIGIAKENQKQIFDEFFQVENKKEIEGVGLGLSIVKNLVNKMNGNISLNFEYKKGTEIKMNLEYKILDESIFEEIKVNYRVIVLSKTTFINKFIEKVFRDYKIDYEILDSYSDYIEKEIDVNDKIIVTDDIEFLSLIEKNNKNVFVIGIQEDNQEDNQNKVNVYDLTYSKILNFLEIKEKLIEEKRIKRVIPKYIDLKVLIVEDNLLNIEILSELLNLMEQKHDIVKNSKETKEILKKNYYDMIFLDLELGEDSGLELGKYIKANYNVELIAVTASITENIKEKVKRIGFDGFIGKPYDLEDIFKAFEIKFFDKKREDKIIYFNERKIKFIKILFESLKKDLSEIERFLEKENYKEIEKQAHKRKGSAGQLKLEELNCVLNNIEKYEKEKQKKMINKEFIKLKEIVEK